MGWFSSLVGGVIGFFVGGPVGAVIGAGLGATKVGEKVVNAVVDFVVQPFMGLFDAPDMGGEAERQQGVLVTRRAGGAESIPVIYGFRKVGGLITFAETGSTTNKYLWVAYVFSEGLVEGLFELYIDDNQLDGAIIADLNAGKEVSITTGKFAKRVVMRWSPGVYYATPSTSTLGTDLKAGLMKDSPSFKNTMTYNGLATLFVRYEWLAVTTQAEADANPFSGSIPDVAAVMLGKRVASLVAGTTNESFTYGGAGYTERYSTNPAEILLDYLRNPRYGKGMSNSEIDWASFRIAAAKCNTEVTYTTTNIKGPIMTCNYVLDTNNSIFQNVKLLLQGFRAYLPYVQGTYKLKIEDAGNPTDITSGAAEIIAECVSTYQIIDASLLDNTYEISGEVTYTGIDRSSKYNQVVVTYVDPRTEFKWSNQQVVYPETEAERQALVSLDGGRENKLEVTFGTITNYAMAKDFAKILLNKSRYAESATLTVSSHAFELEPGDNIRIQSKLLNFGDIPWRVVNISHKENYTFDLGCVRNPDFLYPYTRIGEPDRVNPIYVPKGASIYYPVEIDKPDYSLVPPTQAVTTVPGGTTTNPAPTTPTTTTGNIAGGGVGGSTGSTNTDGTNDTPTTAPKPQPLTDIIDITNLTYVVKNGLTYARLIFTQPQHVMYNGFDYYYGLGSSTVNVTKGTETTLAGAGKSITTDIGPLAIISTLQATANAYTLWARVKYSTGEYSTKFIKIALNPANSAGAGTNPSETIQVVSQAWPTFTEADLSATNNSIERITATVPSLTATRTLNISLVQNVRTEALNTNVNGVNCYYKVSTDTYYTKVSKVFGSYAPGTTTTFAFPGDIGVSGGPVLYDFVFRLTYASGAESTKQYVLPGLRMESPSTVYPYEATYGVNNVTAVKTISEYPIATVDQAPPGTVAAALDTKLGIGSANAGVNFLVSGTTTGMRFFLDPPAVANRATWRGVKIRYRAVIPGTNPALTVSSDSAVTINANGLRVIDVYGMTFDQVYNIIITPQVSSGGVVQDSNFSLAGTGYVHNRTQSTDFPSNNNWAYSFNFQQVDTNTALSQANQAFDLVDPTVDIIACDNRISAATNVNYNGFFLNGSQVVRTNYIRLQYNGDKITGLSKLYIYRRMRATNFGTTGATQTYATHYGVGRWERVEITHTGTGNKIVNLRFPTHFSEFSPYYGVAGYATSHPTLVKVSSNEPPGSTPIAATRGLYTAVDANNQFDLLIVAVVGSTVSAKGSLIRTVPQIAGDLSINLISPNLPSIITYASYPTIQDSDYTAGYQRRLSDARTTSVALATSTTDANKSDFKMVSQVRGTSQVLATPADGPAVV